MIIQAKYKYKYCSSRLHCKRRAIIFLFYIEAVKIDTLKNEQAIAGWLRTICFHKFIDQTRQYKYLIEIEDWNALENGNVYVR
jgi:hypothetical protein